LLRLHPRCAGAVFRAFLAVDLLDAILTANVTVDAGNGKSPTGRPLWLGLFNPSRSVTSGSGISMTAAEAYELAKLHHQAQRFAEAESLYRRVLSLQPSFPECLNNLGAALLNQDKLDEAMECLNQAVALDPNHAGALANIGNTLREMGRAEDAVMALRKAAALQPRDANIHWNLSLALLLTGQFEEGWPAFEARRGVRHVPMHREVTKPHWTGQQFQGQTLLIHEEQGYGDMIQFVRYVPLAKARGGEVIVTCRPPLRRLLKSQCGIKQLISDGDPVPSFDLQSPIITLPLIFGTTVGTIPANVPYIKADANLAEGWRRAIAQLPRALNVGLAWAGSPQHPRDSKRSMQLQSLQPLLSIAGARFLSLQKQGSNNMASESGFLDWTGRLNDFAATAALIANLDIIISVDTAIAHLAGAMGKAVCLLLPFNPDWRWLLNRSDSPWYPTMRLFRQQRPGDWQTPVRQVADELQKLATTRLC
jgi:hypothetical protein